MKGRVEAPPRTRRFAEGTDVPVERSRAELEDLLRKHGAAEIGLHMADAGWTVMYRMRGRMLKQFVRFPEAEPYVLFDPKAPWRKRTAAQIKPLQEKEWRRRWRAAVLILKARLEAVASGDADFEATFLGDILLPDGSTMAEAVKPKLQLAYDSGEMPALMLGTGPKG